MAHNDRPVSRSERELLDLLRGEKTRDPFTVNISYFSDGQWFAETKSARLEAKQGTGKTFEEAWQSRKQSPSGYL